MSMFFRPHLTTALWFCGWCLAAQSATPAGSGKQQGDPASSVVAATAEGPSIDDEPLEPPRIAAPRGAKAMSKPNRVWVDKKKGIVLVDGCISLREGMLEMFACPQGTKEHESIVAVYSSAQVVHAALLAVGAEPGHPVRWDPEFEPPAGTEIAIEAHWQDAAGRWQKLAAEQWVQDAKTGKPMKHHWVFAGSDFWKDEATGKEYYMANSGDFICVSNFSTATLDIPVESSRVNEGLMFRANTAKIPPLGTPVRLVLKPKLPEKKRGKTVRGKGGDLDTSRIEFSKPAHRHHASVEIKAVGLVAQWWSEMRASPACRHEFF